MMAGSGNTLSARMGVAFLHTKMMFRSREPTRTMGIVLSPAARPVCVREDQNCPVPCAGGSWFCGLPAASVAAGRVHVSRVPVICTDACEVAGADVYAAVVLFSVMSS